MVGRKPPKIKASDKTHMALVAGMLASADVSSNGLQVCLEFFPKVEREASAKIMLWCERNMTFT